MMSNQQASISPERRLLILWLAQINSVVLLSALAWFLPTLVELEPSAEFQQPLLLAAFCTLPLIFFIGRWLLGAHKEPSRRDPLKAAVAAETPNTEPPLARSLMVWALCELPVILGFVYVFIGGDPLHAVAMGAAALVLLVLFRPVEQA